MITSKRNPLVRKLRCLLKKTGREEHSSLLLEGSHLLEEALKTNFLPTEVIATPEWCDEHEEVLKKIASRSLLTLVTTNVLEASLSTVTPDGVAAIFPMSGLPKPGKAPKHILALDRIQDPGNMGNLFRTALAAGVNTIFLAGGAHPLGQKVLRASSGAVFHLPFQRFEGTEEEIINSLLKSLYKLSNVGFKIFSTSSYNKNLEKSSKPYWEIDWNKRTALILGNEGKGIHKKIQEAFNETISIPHSELVESLNVACVAVPLLLERKRVAYTSKT